MDKTDNYELYESIVTELESLGYARDYAEYLVDDYELDVDDLMLNANMTAADIARTIELLHDHDADDAYSEQLDDAVASAARLAGGAALAVVNLNMSNNLDITVDGHNLSVYNAEDGETRQLTVDGELYKTADGNALSLRDAFQYCSGLL